MLHQLLQEAGRAGRNGLAARVVVVVESLGEGPPRPLRQPTRQAELVAWRRIAR